MKKILGLLLLLVSFASYGQFSNYTNINGRYKWIAGKFDSTFTLPSGTTPSLRVGGGTGPGALFYSTTDSSVYQYTGNQWTRLRGTDTAHVISAYVRNTTGSILTPGQVVYINGSTGTTPTVALAVNTADSTSAMTFGFVRGNIAVNGFGYITTFGPLEGVNTNAYTEGEVIYLDSIPGQFTHDKPQAPYHMVTLGYIIKKSGGNGTIYAKIQNGYELEELHNVRITAPVLNKSVIIYDSVNGLWVDTTVSAAGLGLGGSGTTNYLSKWTSSTALGNSPIYATSTRVLIGTTTESTYELDVVGDIRSTLDANINGLTVGKGGGSVASNTAFGISVISGSATGTQNVGVGNTALRDLSSGSSNTAVGQAAGRANTTAANNAYFGFAAGIVNTTGGNNTALGTYSGYSMTGSNNTYVGYLSGFDATTASGNTIIGENSGRGITTGNNNTIIGAEVSGLSSSLSNTIILADGQGNQRLYINSSGEAMIGSTTDQGDFKLQVTGQQVIQGVLTAGSPFPNFGYVGVLELKSSNQNALSVYGIKFNNTNTGTAFIGISADNASAYSRPSKSIIHKADGHVFYNSSDVNLFSIFPSTGNISVNSATDAGYKLDVNGTARVSGNVTIAGTGGSVVNLDIYGGSTGGSGQTLRLYATTSNTQGLFLTYTTSSAISYIDAAFHTTGSGNEFGDIVFRSKKNATNTLAENMRIRGFDGNILIGTSTNDASAILNVSSTTKGFLPPRMTGANAEAIGTPASGLLVYINNGNGTTITSTGWWGYDGTNWVKLN